LAIKDMTTDVETDRWFFTNGQGEVQAISESELRLALREDRIAACSPVWRPGWKHWITADRVRQFSKALGARAAAPEAPSVDLKQRQPPPLPAATPAATSVAHFSTPIPPANRQRPLVRRPPIPTIAEGTSVSGGTLRPPGAVPPPPRSIPKSLVGESGEWDTSASDIAIVADSMSNPPLVSQRPSVGHSRSAAGLTSAHWHARHPRADEIPGAPALPTEELSAPQRSTPEAASLSSDPDSLETRPASPVLNLARLGESLRSRGALLWIGLAVSSLGLGMAMILHRPRAAIATQGAAVATSAPPTRLECELARPAQRIAPSVMTTVAPLAADMTLDERLLIGYAENATTATGLSVDPRDLNVRFPFRETKDRRVTSVVPLVDNGHATYHVIRDDSAMKQARAVSASQTFVFGLADARLVRQRLGDAPETIWPVDTTAAITDPRLATVVGLGHAVTFRQGGQSGSIMFGWLTEDGRARSGPFIVRSNAAFVGTPSVAANAVSAMIAYAGRSTESEPWSIFLSRADIGQPPTSAAAFAQPTGGPGGDSIAPTLAALPKKQWLLQWAEGASGQRQVRFQTLAEDGRPIGIARTVSPVGSNSGQGLLWSLGESAVSLFVVNVGRSAELWAAPVHCRH
jgi:hypothetical protein